MTTATNFVILIGRVVRDPEVYHNATTVAKFTLAVERKVGKDNPNSADFISCVCFGKQAEFTERNIRKGIKIAVSGRIQTGSYEKQDGTKVYTTDVVVESCEFCERLSDAQEGGFNGQNGYRASTPQPNTQNASQAPQDAFKRESYNEGFVNASSYSDGVPFN